MVLGLLLTGCSEANSKLPILECVFNDEDKMKLWLDLKELTTEYRKQKLENELKKIKENATI